MDLAKGRASALCSFAVLSGLSLVLSLAHWLSDLHISLAPLYAWEIILFLLTLLSMLWFVIFRNDANNVIDSLAETIEVSSTGTELTNMDSSSCRTKICKPLWARLPLHFTAVAVCCLGSVSMPVFEFFRTIDNMSCFDIKSAELRVILVLKCVRNIMYVLTCICMLVFLLRFKNKSSKSPTMKVLMSTIAATNLTLIVNVIINIIWTSDTMELTTKLPPGNNTGKHLQINMTEEEMKKEMIYLKCINHSVYVDTVATYYYKFSYQFPIEFALLSFCFLGQIWNILPQERRTSGFAQENEMPRNTLDDNENSERRSDVFSAQSELDQESLIGHRVPTKLRWIKSAALSTFVFSCSHVFIPTAILVVAIFILHLYTEIKDETFDDENVILECHGNSSCVDSPNSIVQTIYTYVFSIVSFIGFMVARKEKKSYDMFNGNDILFLIGAGGHLLLILFETIDNIWIITGNDSSNTGAEKVLFSFKTFCRIIGIYSQTIFVIKSTKIKIRRKSMKTGKQLFIKAVVVFLGVCNLEIWLADSFLEPTVLQFNDNTNYGQAYGRKNWFFMTQLLYPLVTLYRLLTTVMCFEACLRFRRYLQ